MLILKNDNRFSDVGSGALVHKLAVAADPRGVHSRLAVCVLLVHRVLSLVLQPQEAKSPPFSIEHTAIDRVARAR